MQKSFIGSVSDESLFFQAWHNQFKPLLRRKYTEYVMKMYSDNKVEERVKFKEFCYLVFHTKDGEFDFEINKN